jgi:recombination protein RecA
MKHSEQGSQTSIRAVLAAVQKAHGAESLCLLGDEVTSSVESIPSGSLALDLALGIGGYPRGRIVEVYGPESSGKTTLALHAMAQAQLIGGCAAYVDAEHTFDAEYARNLGVDLSNLLLSQPDSGEQALDVVEALAASGHVSLVVIDSVAALVPQAELDGSMSDNPLGLQARLMSRALRKLAVVAAKTQTTLLFVNQLRQKIGVVFGSPETTPGGNALKFYASMRLDVRRIGKVSLAEEVVGNRTRVKVVKNKCAPPFREAEFDIRWGSGVDTLADLIDAGLACQVLTQSGSHFAFAGRHLAQGRERTREALNEDLALQAAVCSAVRGAFSAVANSAATARPTVATKAAQAA